LLRFAKYYAMTRHMYFYKKGGIQLYSGLPYTHHLAAVEQVMLRYYPKSTDEMRAACWLHDSVEDTFTKVKDIQENFGRAVADLVWAVTNEEGPNRKARAAATYPKIRCSPGAVRLKLADRIANVEHGGDMVDAYKKEYEDFKRSLYMAGEYEEMWARLDDLLIPKPALVEETVA
jgi:(p)ppGpp synthase/HD superfamily hydrolase